MMHTLRGARASAGMWPHGGGRGPPYPAARPIGFPRPYYGAPRPPYQRPRPGQQPQPPRGGDSINVFVGRLSDAVPDAFLSRLLAQCGTVAKWLRGSATFGFCEFASPAGAARALQLLQGLRLAGREMIVRVDAKAQPRIKAFKESLQRPVDKKFGGGEKADDDRARVARVVISKLVEQLERECVSGEDKSRPVSGDADRVSGDTDRVSGDTERVSVEPLLPVSVEALLQQERRRSDLVAAQGGEKGQKGQKGQVSSAEAPEDGEIASDDEEPPPPPPLSTVDTTNTQRVLSLSLGKSRGRTSKRKKAAVGPAQSVFGKEEAPKRRKLIPLQDSDSDDERPPPPPPPPPPSAAQEPATTVAAHKSEQPTVSNGETQPPAYAKDVNWRLVDMLDLVENNMRPWVAQRVKALLGIEEKDLVNFILKLLSNRTPPSAVERELSAALGPGDAKALTADMWARLFNITSAASKYQQV